MAHTLVTSCCNKTCDGSSSRKEELVLVPGLVRYLTHYDVRSVTQLITLHHSQGRREQIGSRARLLNLKVHLQWHTSSSKFCPLKILQPPKTSPPKPAGDRAFKHLGPWRTFTAKPQMKCVKIVMIKIKNISTLIPLLSLLSSVVVTFFPLKKNLNFFQLQEWAKYFLIAVVIITDDSSMSAPTLFPL